MKYRLTFKDQWAAGAYIERAQDMWTNARDDEEHERESRLDALLRLLPDDRPAVIPLELVVIAAEVLRYALDNEDVQAGDVTLEEIK